MEPDTGVTFADVAGCDGSKLELTLALALTLTLTLTLSLTLTLTLTLSRCDGSKLELEEVVDFLKNPTKYSSVGAKVPRG